MPRPPSVLTPELLKTFVTMVRVDGSVARAAQLLDINEASVSKRIKPLHEGSPPTLPLPWLEKHGKLFQMTEEGKRMLPAAEDQLRRWENFVAFIEAGRLVDLAVGCGQEAVTGILFDAVKLWRREYPDLTLRISTPRGKVRIEAVAAGLLDLALVSHDEAQIERIARRQLFVEKLTDDPLRLACSVKAPWASAFAELSDKGVRAPALLQFPVILPESDSGVRQQIDQRLFDADVLRQLTIALEVGGWQAQLAYVREGVGVGLLPASVLARHDKGLMVKALSTELVPPHRLRVICRGTNVAELSDAGHALRRALHEVARNLFV